MTAALIAALVVIVGLVVALVVRERSHRAALEQARRHLTESTVQAEEDARLRREAEESVQQHVASVASAEVRLTVLEATTGRRNEQLEQRLRKAEAERIRLDEAAAARALEAEATSARMAEVEAASAASDAARDSAGARVNALERELDVLRARVESPGTPAGEEPASPAVPHAEGRGDLGWRLLLARVERQWADAVNAGADERGVIESSPGEQFAQAIERDLERLREEVGVQTTIVPTKPIRDLDPLTTLLAVGETVALLAYHSEHVRVDLSDPAVMSGEDWTGDDDALRKLEALAARATGGGLPAAVTLVDRVVQMTLGARH